MLKLNIGNAHGIPSIKLKTTPSLLWKEGNQAHEKARETGPINQSEPLFDYRARKNALTLYDVIGATHVFQPPIFTLVVTLILPNKFYFDHRNNEFCPAI